VIILEFLLLQQSLSSCDYLFGFTSLAMKSKNLLFVLLSDLLKFILVLFVKILNFFLSLSFNVLDLRCVFKSKFLDNFIVLNF